jgi:hypothetical protein
MVASSSRHACDHLFTEAGVGARGARLAAGDERVDGGGEFASIEVDVVGVAVEHRHRGVGHCVTRSCGARSILLIAAVTALLGGVTPAERVQAGNPVTASRHALIARVAV